MSMGGVNRQAIDTERHSPLSLERARGRDDVVKLLEAYNVDYASDKADRGSDSDDDPRRERRESPSRRKSRRWRGMLYN